MWNIYEVKQSARAKLSLSYWKSVLVALILTVVTSAGAGNAGGIYSLLPDVACAVINGNYAIDFGRN